MRPNRHARLTDTSGFTLIEVLVAFTVLATLLSVMYRGVVGLRAGSNAFDDHTIQDIVARRLLDEALANHNLAAGTYTGVRDGYHWAIVAKSIDLSKQLPPPDPNEIDEKAGMTNREGAPGQTQGVPSQSQGVAENGKVVAPPKQDEANWKTQRILVKIETKGKPLEIETIRLVSLKRER